MNRTKHLVILTEQAKEGNTEAINRLIEKNSKMITKFAQLAYEELKLKYNLHYNLDEDNLLPNNIIDLDDIIQEFYIKSLKYLKTYLKTDYNNTYYFSSFLGNYLSKFKPLYVKKVLKKIIKQNDNEIIETLDLRFYNYTEQKQKQDIVNYIMSIIEIDKVLIYYKDFIKDILDGLSYKELQNIHKLPTNRLNMKLKKFCEIYKKHEEINLLLLESMNKDYVLDKILNNKILEVPYYKFRFDQVIEKLQNTYQELPPEYIEDYIYRTMFKWLNKYLTENEFNIQIFNKEFNDKLNRQVLFYKGQPPKKKIKK